MPIGIFRTRNLSQWVSKTRLRFNIMKMSQICQKGVWTRIWFNRVWARNRIQKTSYEEKLHEFNKAGICSTRLPLEWTNLRIQSRDSWNLAFNQNARNNQKSSYRLLILRALRLVLMKEGVIFKHSKSAQKNQRMIPYRASMMKFQAKL